MNTKFRKKPVVIEAFQMTRERLISYEWPDWLQEAWNKSTHEEGAFYPETPGADDGPLLIVTLEGTHQVSLGDWIIRGVKGELYPCKPDVFEATYEPADGGQTPEEDK